MIYWTRCLLIVWTVKNNIYFSKVYTMENKNMYAQFDELLKVVIAKWWKPHNLLPVFNQIMLEDHWKLVRMSCNIFEIVAFRKCKDVEKVLHMSYHDLFSQDSLFMERLNWKSVRWDELNLPDWRYFWDDHRGYHACIMWTMSAQHKIKYVLDNTVK